MQYLGAYPNLSLLKTLQTVEMMEHFLRSNLSHDMDPLNRELWILKFKPMDLIWAIEV
jgi:hypothetical protein